MSSQPAGADTQPGRVHDYFAGPDGEHHYDDLLEFAERQVRSRRWCVRTADHSMPGGRTPEDLVNETIRDTLAEPGDSHRRTIPARVEIGHGLKCIIESKANNASRHAENRQRKDHRGTNREGEPVDYLDSAVPFWDPGTADLDPEEMAELAATRDRFITFCKGDKDVHAMLVLVRDRGIAKPAELVARELGLTVAEVFLARKRLRTLLRKFKKTEERT